jgi:hypothetical protein
MCVNLNDETNCNIDLLFLAMASADPCRPAKAQKCAPRVCIRITGQSQINFALRSSLRLYRWQDGDTHQVKCVVCNGRFIDDATARGCPEWCAHS